MHLLYVVYLLLEVYCDCILCCSKGFLYLANCNCQKMQFATELVNLHAIIIIVVLCMHELIVGILVQTKCNCGSVFPALCILDHWHIRYF
jgi:hypothetical protein